MVSSLYISHSRLLLIIVLMLACVGVTLAIDFKTKKLKVAAEMLGISSQLDSVPSGNTIILLVKGEKICIRKDNIGIIEHIGIPIFDQGLRIAADSPIYDFLEYAALNERYRFSNNLLYLNRVIFKNGNWSSLREDNLKDCQCVITNKEDKLYIVDWRQEDKSLLCLGIPKDYELLANESRRNIEKDFIRQIKLHQYFHQHRDANVVKEKDLKIYGTEGLFVYEGQSYLIPELNQNMYYRLKTVKETYDSIMYNRHNTLCIEEVVPEIVVDSIFPSESLANLMMNNDMSIPDVVMNIDFHLSDYNKQSLSMPLSLLKDFFYYNRCNIYYACCVPGKEETQGYLVVNNYSEGYNHLINVSIPNSNLMESNPEVHGTAYLYIPQLEESKLFGKIPIKKSGAKIY